MITFGLIITILLIILGFLFKSNKIISVLQFLWIAILLIGSNGGMDYNVHEMIFSEATSNFNLLSLSWLYKLICFLFGNMGYEFVVMNSIVSILILIILYKLIFTNTKNSAMTLSLFMIFPLADCIIQKRNFAALGIGLIGLFLLLRESKPKDRILSFVLILISAQVHPLFYVYLLVWFLMKYDYNKLRYMVLLLTVLGFFLIPITPNLASFFMSDSKINFYFYTAKIPLYQSLCWWILHACFYMLFQIIFKFSKIDNKNKKIINNLQKLNLIMFIFIFLYYYEPSFFRIYRNVLILFYIGVGICFESKKLLKNQFYAYLCLIIFAVLVFISQFVIFGDFGFERLINPIFEDNYILNGG